MRWRVDVGQRQNQQALMLGRATADWVLLDRASNGGYCSYPAFLELTLTLKELWIPSSEIHRALFRISSDLHQILQNSVQVYSFHWGFDQETFLRAICRRKTSSLQQMLQL